MRRFHASSMCLVYPKQRTHLNPPDRVSSSSTPPMAILQLASRHQYLSPIRLGSTRLRTRRLKYCKRQKPLGACPAVSFLWQEPWHPPGRSPATDISAQATGKVFSCVRLSSEALPRS